MEPVNFITGASGLLFCEIIWLQESNLHFYEEIFPDDANAQETALRDTAKINHPFDRRLT